MNPPLCSALPSIVLLAAALALATPRPVAAGELELRKSRAQHAQRERGPVALAEARVHEAWERSVEAPIRAKAGAPHLRAIKKPAASLKAAQRSELARLAGARAKGTRPSDRLELLLEKPRSARRPDGAGAGVPGSPCAVCTTQPIACDTGADGALTPEDCTEESGAFADLYELTIDEPRELTIELRSTEFDPFVILLGDSCTTLATNDDCELGNLELSCITATLPPGRYRVLATAFAAGATGAYRLDVACGELGDCTGCDASELPCGESTSATIAATDCRAGNGSFFDVYDFSLAESGRVQIEVRSQQIDSVLQVVDPLCTLLGENDDCEPFDTSRSCLTLDLPAGNFQAVVSTFAPGETGPYEIELTCLPGFDPCMECATGEASCDVPFDGNFPATTCIRAEGQNLDLYAFTLTEDTGVDISLTSSVIDSYLLLFDASCALLAENDDCGPTLDSCISADLPAGDYFAGVSSFGNGEEGPFQLTVRCSTLEGCADCIEGSLDCNGQVDDALDESSCVADGRRKDLWQLELFDALNVRLELSADFEASVALLDARCGPLGELTPCDGAPGTLCLEGAAVNPGSYLVEVAAAEEITASYSLSAACASFVPCNDCVVAPIACGDTLQRSTDDSACVFPDPFFIDVFSFTLDEPREIEVTMSSADFDTVVVVLDGTCGVLAANDDCAPGVSTDSCITVTLPAGEHFIGTTVFDVGLGAYELAVSCRESRSCQDCVSGSVECGIARPGRLENGDCVTTGSFLDVYELTVDEAARLSLEVTSTEFDTFLLVLDTECVPLAQNDDCEPGNLQLSCLEVDLEPGNYLVGVSSFDVGETGAYEVLVNAESCAAGGLRLPGDVDQDGLLDSADGMRILEWLLAPEIPPLPCTDDDGPRAGTLAVGDFNGSGRVDVSDAVSVFYFLFQEGPPHVLGMECVPLAGCTDSVDCSRGP